MSIKSSNLNASRLAEQLRLAGRNVIKITEADELQDAAVEISATLSVQCTLSNQFVVVRQQDDEFIFSPPVGTIEEIIELTSDYAALISELAAKYRTSDDVIKAAHRSFHSEHASFEQKKHFPNGCTLGELIVFLVARQSEPLRERQCCRLALQMDCVCFIA